jgi:transcriptional regulator with XRE-family HTH domain
MNKQIYERIFELIQSRDMTQKEFSSLTGISESTISDWKHKKFNPGADKIPVICKVLNISANELFDMDDIDEANNRKYYLSDDEKQLIDSFREAKDEEKKYLLSYAKFLYKK